MSRCVRIAVAALFALSIVLQTPSASAATRDRESFAPGFVQRTIRTIKRVLKPLAPVATHDDNPYPVPPKP